MRHLKLQQTPPRRTRVHDLAKYVQRPTTQVMEALADLGEYVKGPNSVVEEPVVRRICDHFDLPHPDGPWKPGPTVKSPSLDEAPPTPRGLPPAPVRPRRENHPMMDATGGPPRPSRAGGPRHGKSPGRQSDPFGAGLDAAPTWAFEEWKIYGFTDIERDVWISSGLRQGQAKTAAGLRDAGLTPQDLNTNVAGWTVLQRVTHGEGAAGVARLLHNQRAKPTG
jgi:hypothetical protein